MKNAKVLPFISIVLLQAIVAAPSARSAEADALPSLRSEALAIASVCRADFNRLCANVRIGGGRVIACLETNRNLLSSECRAALPRAQQLKADADRLGVTPK